MATAAITATLEDYLEAILNIISQTKVARSMEIAEKLNVKRPTVTVALRSLAEKGLINYEPRSYITLTQKGKKIAQCVDKRHHILRDVFTHALGLSLSEAEDAACRMEHGMTTSVCKKLTSLLNVINKNDNLANELKTAIIAEDKNINCEKSCDYGTSKKDLNMNQEMSDLNMLHSGDSAKIVKILGTGNLKKRLREMGITAGEKVSIVKAAPLDDPIEIKIRNYNLSLRRDEAANILVESI